MKSTNFILLFFTIFAFNINAQTPQTDVVSIIESINSYNYQQKVNKLLNIISNKHTNEQDRVKAVAGLSYTLEKLDLFPAQEQERAMMVLRENILDKNSTSLLIDHSVVAYALIGNNKAIPFFENLNNKQLGMYGLGLIYTQESSYALNRILNSYNGADYLIKNDGSLVQNNLPIQILNILANRGVNESSDYIHFLGKEVRSHGKIARNIVNAYANKHPSARPIRIAMSQNRLKDVYQNVGGMISEVIYYLAPIAILGVLELELTAVIMSQRTASLAAGAEETIALANRLEVENTLAKVNNLKRLGYDSPKNVISFNERTLPNLDDDLLGNIGNTNRPNLKPVPSGGSSGTDTGIDVLIKKPKVDNIKVVKGKYYQTLDNGQTYIEIGGNGNAYRLMPDGDMMPAYNPPTPQENKYSKEVKNELNNNETNKIIDHEYLAEVVEYNGHNYYLDETTRLYFKEGDWDKTHAYLVNAYNGNVTMCTDYSPPKKTTNEASSKYNRDIFIANTKKIKVPKPDLSSFKTVLIVADNASFTTSLKKHFEELFHSKVEAVSSFTEAHQLLLKKDYSFIVLDYHLSNSDLGTELCNDIRNSFNHKVPIVCMSGSFFNTYESLWHDGFSGYFYLKDSSNLPTKEQFAIWSIATNAYYNIWDDVFDQALFLGKIRLIKDKPIDFTLNNKKLLIVTNEHLFVNEFIAKTRHTRKNVQVISADNVHDAQLLLQKGTHYDFILIDDNLNGFEKGNALCKNIRDALDNITPIISISSAFFTNEEYLWNLGFNGHLYLGTLDIVDIEEKLAVWSTVKNRFQK